MSNLVINHDQFKELSKNPCDGPVVMLNLLKFRADGGMSLYGRYMKEADRFVAAVGGKMIFLATPRELLYGDNHWDAMMLVRYPSRKAFIDMINDPEYIKIHGFREESLEKAVLYAMDEITAKEFLRGD